MGNSFFYGACEITWWRWCAHRDAWLVENSWGVILCLASSLLSTRLLHTDVHTDVHADVHADAHADYHIKGTGFLIFSSYCVMAGGNNHLLVESVLEDTDTVVRPPSI